MRRLLCFGVLAILLSLAQARSEELRLPGLQRDAQAYAHSLQRRFPAGATAAHRAQAERSVRDALATQDWAGAVQALSERLGQGETNSALWLALAQALLRQPQPDAPHVLAAAWQSYAATETAADKVAALRVMRDALALLHRPVEEWPSPRRWAYCTHAVVLAVSASRSCWAVLRSPFDKTTTLEDYCSTSRSTLLANRY